MISHIGQHALRPTTGLAVHGCIEQTILQTAHHAISEPTPREPERLLLVQRGRLLLGENGLGADLSVSGKLLRSSLFGEGFIITAECTVGTVSETRAETGSAKPHSSGGLRSRGQIVEQLTNSARSSGKGGLRLLLSENSLGAKFRQLQQLRFLVGHPAFSRLLLGENGLGTDLGELQNLIHFLIGHPAFSRLLFGEDGLGTDLRQFQQLRFLVHGTCLLRKHILIGCLRHDLRQLLLLLRGKLRLPSRYGSGRITGNGSGGLTGSLRLRGSCLRLLSGSADLTGRVHNRSGGICDSSGRIGRNGRVDANGGRVHHGGIHSGFRGLVQIAKNIPGNGLGIGDGIGRCGRGLLVLSASRLHALQRPFDGIGCVHVRGPFLVDVVYGRFQ